MDSVILNAIDATIAARFCNVLTTKWLRKTRWLFKTTTRSVCGLLFRGSSHGMTPRAFHQRCDQQGPTLTLIRADEGGRVCVFGGYTSEPWHSWGEFVQCADAFLFSVVGPYCSVVRFPVKKGWPGEEWAMHCNSAYGPCFGYDLAVMSSSGEATAPFGDASYCVSFGHPSLGAYQDTVGMGPRTFTGTTDPHGCFTPLDIEVYAVV